MRLYHAEFLSNNALRPFVVDTTSIDGDSFVESLIKEQGSAVFEVLANLEDKK